MQEILVDTSIDYPRTSRTVLSRDDNTLAKTFERIRSGAIPADIPRVELNDGTACSARIPLEKDEGTGYWEFVRLSECFFAIAADYQYNETRAESVLGEGFLQFHFKVSGELLLETGSHSKLSVKGPSLLIWNQPASRYVKEWMKGDVRESSFTLYCKKEFFSSELAIDTARVPNIVASFLNQASDSIEYEVIPLNPALAFSITNLLKSDFSGQFRLIHTKAKAYDLLCDAFQYLYTAKIPDNSGKIALSNYENQRLHEARDILTVEFNPPPTISVLARRIGINETKLKRGFKQLFGATIHDYGNYHRMQKALELLQTSELSISSIGECVGYRYQTSFTAAVKHFFGVTPKQLRDSTQA